MTGHDASTRRDSELLYPVAPERLREVRHARLRALMDSHGLSAILGFSTDSVTGRGNVRFLADWPTPIRQSGAIVDEDGHTTLLVTHLTHTHWAGELGWADEKRLVGNLAQEALEILKQRYLTKSGVAVGVVGQELIGAHLDELQGLAGNVRLRDMNAPFSVVRRPASEFEAPFYALNGAIIDAVLDAVVSELRAGMRENEIHAVAQAALSAHGCEDSLILIGSGTKHNMPVPSARVLEAGDVIRFSVEPCGPGGYWAQVARTFCIGNAADEVQEVHDAVQQGLNRGLEMVRPGLPVRDLATEIATGLTKARSIRPEVVIGHGVGLNLAEAPRLTSDSTEKLVDGAVLTIHPGAYRETFGVFIGQTIRVTAEGAVPITRSPLRLISVPA